MIVAIREAGLVLLTMALGVAAAVALLYLPTSLVAHSWDAVGELSVLALAGVWLFNRLIPRPPTT